jgi:hypothetical protein
MFFYFFFATQLELKSNYVQRVKDNLNFGTELSVRTRPPPKKLNPKTLTPKP